MKTKFVNEYRMANDLVRPIVNDEYAKIEKKQPNRTLQANPIKLFLKDIEENSLIFCCCFFLNNNNYYK